MINRCLYHSLSGEGKLVRNLFVQNNQIFVIHICQLPINYTAFMGLGNENFKPNFKFSRLEFFGGPPSHFGCALSRIGQSLTRVKFSGRSTPYGLNSQPKKYILLGANSHVTPSR